MIFRNFAVFEGIDGTGTTTQLREIEKRYSSLGRKTWFTAEPTDGDTGKLIRTILSGESRVHPDTMARLFAADRCEHLYGVGGIAERLADGTAVFSDRYVFSSLAYQGSTCDPELTALLNADFPLPEYVFFFDIDPAVSMERIRARGGSAEIYEREAFQRLVRERYRRLFDRYETEEPGMRVVRIDASRPIAEITEKIWSIVSELPKIYA